MTTALDKSFFDDGKMGAIPLGKETPCGSRQRFFGE